MVSVCTKSVSMAHLDGFIVQGCHIHFSSFFNQSNSEQLIHFSCKYRMASIEASLINVRDFFLFTAKGI